MKIYQVSYSGDPDGHKGYGYFPSKAKAKRDKREWDKQECSHGTHEAEITEIEVTPTKRFIIKLLNIHAGHPDNG